MTYRIEKPVNWRGLEKAEAELRRRHDAFLRWSRVALQHATEELLAEMRASPRPNGTAPRLNDGEEYELERFPFETFVDGMRSPGE